jgi:hypothetical protein
MALVYRQRDERGVAISQTQLATHTSILVSPRLLLSMLVTHRQQAQTVAGKSVSTPSIGRAEVPRTVLTLRNSEQPVRTHSEIVERIVRRTVRQELVGKAIRLPAASNGTRIATSAPAVSEGATASSVSGMVYRSNTRTNHERPTVAERAEAEPQRPAVTALRHAPAPVQSEAEIAQITDQVLHALDRRIVAQRERMGRV